MDGNRLQELARLLVKMGCPPGKAEFMALKLDKRAAQLAELRGRPYEEALVHLMGLMRQGMANPPATSGEDAPVQPPGWQPPA